jgi:hypothetical protein
VSSKLVLTVAALGMLAVACDWEESLQVALVTNEIDRSVIVYIDPPDGPEVDVMRLAPGESDTTDFSSPAHCSEGPLIARTVSGDQVARREMLCVADEWVITQE